MEYVYLLLPNRAEWHEITVFLTEEEALQASIDHPNFRVEIFEKRENNAPGYIPTYGYFKKGKWINGK